MFSKNINMFIFLLISITMVSKSYCQESQIKVIGDQELAILQARANSEVLWTIAPGTRARSDYNGKWNYLVDLTLDSKSALDQDDIRIAKTKEAVGIIEKDYGIQAKNVFSLLTPGFSAYLNTEQLAALSNDSRVRRITLDVELKFSASEQTTSAVWSDVKAGLSTVSWGTNSMLENWSPSSSSGLVTVYVVDAGVGVHTDLNVIKRLNGVDNYQTWAGIANIGMRVGCYAHATHVAGIIGARLGGNGTTVGILPDARIVSVAVIGSANYNSNYNCLDEFGADTLLGLQSALEAVREDIPTTTSARAAIVNISMNDFYGNSVFASNGSVGQRMLALATPTAGYPGAFVVQSAGNNFDSAYSHAYRPVSTSDGIMVVGAINAHGQPVVPLNDYFGFRNEHISDPNPPSGNEPGSNYGSTVEAWAPGNRIISLFANWPQQGHVTYSTTATISGTSMAAPHVAGIAARLAEAQSLLTPSSIESAVRSKFRNLGSTDSSGAAMRMPAMNPLPSPASKPYSEIVVRKTPITPCVMPNCPRDPYNININRAISSNIGSQIWLSLDSYGSAPVCQAWRYPAWPSSTNANSLVGNEGIHTVQVQAALPFLASKNCPGGVIKIEIP